MPDKRGILNPFGTRVRMLRKIVHFISRLVALNGIFGCPEAEISYENILDVGS